MRQVEWTVDAQTDLAGIDNFYADRSPEFADRVGDAAIAGAQFLRERPYAGTPIGAGVERKWSVRRSPYVLFYRLVDDRVQILRVRHARENWQAEP